MNITRVLQSGKVVRYHNTLIQRKQMLDSHQWEVAIILMEIYPQCSADLLFHALTHDSEELYTGDMPAPVKWDNPSIKKTLDDAGRVFVINDLDITLYNFSALENLALKHADILSGLWFCAQQYRAGDKEALDVYSAWDNAYHSQPYLNEASLHVKTEVYNYVSK